MLAETQERAKTTEYKGVAHYKRLGCNDPTVPQEALDVTVRSRDSPCQGAESRAQMHYLRM